MRDIYIYIVCFLRRSSVFGTAKYFCGVGATALRAKGSGFAHNPMTSLARGSFEKDTPNALSIPPSAVGVPEDCWPCSNARTSRKLERQRRPYATFSPQIPYWLGWHLSRRDASIRAAIPPPYARRAVISIEDKFLHSRVVTIVSNICIYRPIGRIVESSGRISFGESLGEECKCRTRLRPIYSKIRL